ncbi:MAG: phosphatase PAP2 family protein [Candidatus Micrarchaeaceae archaeon]|jgi:undecaprenyl-diphosphatase|nr:phosphatase PAP2 family protein [Candidatus Micrarchaeota archaeon]HII09632.1 phosphatase PAP2 family protein [Candidatus Micrarchaeota archaeon]
MVFESWIANTWAFQFVNGIASPTLTKFMLLIADSFWVVIPIIALYLYLKKDKNIYAYVLGVVVIYVIADIIKLITMEPRPCSVSSLSWINHPACEATFSFPSEHAAVLSGIPIFLSKYKVLTVLYIIWVVLVLFGRVYLGLHYLSDVITGVILSILIWYVIYTYRMILSKKGQGILHLIKE